MVPRHKKGKNGSKDDWYDNLQFRSEHDQSKDTNFIKSKERSPQDRHEKRSWKTKGTVNNKMKQETDSSNCPNLNHSSKEAKGGRSRTGLLSPSRLRNTPNMHTAGNVDEIMWTKAKQEGVSHLWLKPVKKNTFLNVDEIIKWANDS